MKLASILREIPETLRLALPIMLGMAGHMVIQLTDTIMLGRYGTTELAASAFAGSLVLLVLYAGLGFGQAVSVLGGQALGSADKNKARGIYHLSAMSALVYSALGVILVIAALPLLDHMGQPELVAAHGKPYAILIALSFVPTLVFQPLKNYYEAHKRAWVPFGFMLGVVILNIALNWVFIYGNLGAPEMGIIGSGLGTLLARMIVFAAFVLYAKRKGEPLYESADRNNLPWGSLRKILTIAAASGSQMIATTLAYVLGGIWIGMISAQALAANRVIGIFDATVYMIPLGLAVAMTVRIARAKGAGMMWQGVNIYRGGLAATIVLYGGVCTAMILNGRGIIMAFTQDPQIIQIGEQLIIIAAIFCMFDGISCITLGALRAIGDVVAPAVIYLGIYWILAMPLGYHMAFGLKMGAAGVWWGYCVGIILASLALVARWQYMTRYAKEDNTHAQQEPAMQAPKV